jgi:hypothetical protein
VTPETVSADAAAGSRSIAITSSGTWTAQVNSGAAVWCSLSPASGTGTVTVNIAENPATASRAATVTVTAGTLSKTVGVTQQIFPVVYEVDDAPLYAKSNKV